MGIYLDSNQFSVVTFKNDRQTCETIHFDPLRRSQLSVNEDISKTWEIAKDVFIIVEILAEVTKSLSWR